MADDLNDFLRQAALRREARKRASGQSSTQGRPINQEPKRSLASEQELEVIQPIPVEQRHLTPHVPPPEHLSGNVAKVDQKRETHLREVFGNKPVPLVRPSKKNKSNPTNPLKTPVATISPPTDKGSVTSEPLSISGKGDPPGNYKVMTPQDLLKLLRNPDSLKMAFIASEIFGRKFQ